MNKNIVLISSLGLILMPNLTNSSLAISVDRDSLDLYEFTIEIDRVSHNTKIDIPRESSTVNSINGFEFGDTFNLQFLYDPNPNNYLFVHEVGSFWFFKHLDFSLIPLVSVEIPVLDDALVQLNNSLKSSYIYWVDEQRGAIRDTSDYFRNLFTFSSYEEINPSKRYTEQGFFEVTFSSEPLQDHSQFPEVLTIDLFERNYFFFSKYMGLQSKSNFGTNSFDKGWRSYFVSGNLTKVTCLKGTCLNSETVFEPSNLLTLISFGLIGLFQIIFGQLFKKKITG